MKNKYGTEVIDALTREERIGTPLTLEEKAERQERIDKLILLLKEKNFDPALKYEENGYLLNVIEAAVACNSNKAKAFYEKIFMTGHFFVSRGVRDAVNERLYSKLPEGK